MKKTLITLLIITSLMFAYSFRSILVGNGGTKDTIIGAAADTVNLSRALNGCKKINSAFWVDTIGASGSNLTCVVQVSPDNSHWLNFHAAVFGDSISGEDCALKLDTVDFNNALGQSNIGCFRYVRFIFAGVYSNQKSILSYYLQCWY